MQHFNLRDLPQQPWNNGRGSTRLVASAGDGSSGTGFYWRVSVAEIAENCPFSIFPGVDRIAIVLENGPLRLCQANALDELALPRYVASQNKPIAFDGALELHAYIISKPVLCLNIMTRRGAAQAEVHVISASTAINAAPDTILLAAGDGWRLDQAALPKHSGVLIGSHSPIRATAGSSVNGPLICVTLTNASLARLDKA